MTSARAIADYLRALHTPECVGRALMTLVEMARAGDGDAEAEARKALEWLLREWKP